ncbi:MAG: TIGR04282 family arsenosugar biosynthesis glycosyltransferase, partial [Chloroflexota bacterium]|nr:TIGR04282 family arsenosugar biosynthesis glycosyltransferase [Chloroflexota bacterium]
LPPSGELWPQEGEGLGVGLGGAFARGFARGYRRVLIISSDSPTLPRKVFEEAFAALDDHDLVLGPTHDGGYYLIGLTRPEPHLFEGIAWSTDAVYGQTLERAAERGLRVHTTAAWHDVDTIADLAPLAEHCRRGAAPHTAEILGNAAVRALLREAGVGVAGHRSQVAGATGEERQLWETLGTEWLLRSPWRSLRRDRVRLHTGAEIDYSYLETPRAAWVVPLTAEGEIVLIHQYRYPVRGWVWEVPAGAIGEEAPVEAARRELAEEIGGRCRELRAVGRFYSSSAHLTLEAHVYLALDVELAGAAREATELLEVVRLPADEAFARARSGAINEGQSALALLMAEPLVRGLKV